MYIYHIIFACEGLRVSKYGTVHISAGPCGCVQVCAYARSKNACLRFAMLTSKSCGQLCLSSRIVTLTCAKTASVAEGSCKIVKVQQPKSPQWPRLQFVDWQRNHSFPAVESSLLSNSPDLHGRCESYRNLTNLACLQSGFPRAS